MIMDTIALDSVRTKDENGYLHVAVSNITKEQIAPYYGHTIPGWKELGLEANKIYQIYRSADEIAKAVDTFNGIPLAYEHHKINAKNIPKEYIIGSLGTDARFEAPYLKNSLTVIDADAIKAIEDGSFKELSAGYAADIVMEGGIFDGQTYDGFMTNIRGNHVAIVPEGRAGHDVRIEDSAIEGGEKPMDIVEKLKQKLMEVFESDEVKNMAEVKDMEETQENDIPAEVVKPADEEPTPETPAEPKEEPAELETPAEPEAPAEDEEGVEELAEEIKAMMTEAGLDAEDKAQQKAFIAGMAVQDKCKDKCTDAKPVDYRAIYNAAEKVAPIIGKLADPFAFTDANDIYEKALTHEGICLDGVDRSAYGAMVAMLSRQEKKAEPKKADPLNDVLSSIKTR